MKTFNVAVIGVGHLGKEHARIYSALTDVRLAAVVDNDVQLGQNIARQYHTSFYRSTKALLKQPLELDAVNIVTPTKTHYAIAREFIKRGIHTFVEKPITVKTSEAKTLVKMARRKRVVLQVGHIQRFNPALQAVWSEIKQPRFIEAHRLSSFTARSFDIDVVLDLMIHDLDLVLALTRSPLKQVDANGVKVLSNMVDIVNARLVFRNGCVANLTASRISDKSMRRLRAFTSRAYFSVDFLVPEATIYQRRTPPKDFKTFLTKTPLSKETLHMLMTQQFYQIRKPEINREEPLHMELASFIECAMKRRTPLVTGEDGLKALELAHQILKKI